MNDRSKKAAFWLGVSCYTVSLILSGVAVDHLGQVPGLTVPQLRELYGYQLFFTAAGVLCFSIIFFKNLYRD